MQEIANLGGAQIRQMIVFKNEIYYLTNTAIYRARRPRWYDWILRAFSCSNSSQTIAR